MFERITIIGTGLIGGSLGLALHAAGFRGRITGCDTPKVLEQAKARGAIDAAVPALPAAVGEAQLIVLAVPVEVAVRLLPEVAAVAPKDSLITDVGSTKRKLVAAAREVFGTEAAQRVLPGHPMTGRERGGIENADAALFQGASWLLTPLPRAEPERLAALSALIGSIGAVVSEIPADVHDRALAYTSHLPQLVSYALVEAAREALPPEVDPVKVSGPGWRDMTRLAHSPEDLWRGILASNSENVDDALRALEIALERVRERLRQK